MEDKVRDREALKICPSRAFGFAQAIVYSLGSPPIKMIGGVCAYCFVAVYPHRVTVRSSFLGHGLHHMSWQWEEMFALVSAPTEQSLRLRT